MMQVKGEDNKEDIFVTTGIDEQLTVIEQTSI